MHTETSDTRDQAEQQRGQLAADGIHTAWDMSKSRQVMVSVLMERQRQSILYSSGRFDFTCADPRISPLRKLAVLTEEIGEVSKECNELHQPGARDRLRTELVQVAAVALAWLESMEGV